MDEFKPNIKIELVNLWSDTVAKPVKVIKLVVNRESSKECEVHYFLFNSFTQNLELAQNHTESNCESLFHNLTKREQEILVNVAKGATSIEISEKLYISVNTVKNHRRNIKMKLNLTDTIEYSKFLRWVHLNIE